MAEAHITYSYTFEGGRRINRFVDIPDDGDITADAVNAALEDAPANATLQVVDWEYTTPDGVKKFGRHLVK